MPPKKRGRSVNKNSTTDDGDGSHSNKRAKTPTADLPPLPPKPAVDTYKPENVKKPEELAALVEQHIQNTAKRLKIETPGQFQVRLSISNTEGDLLLGKDGKSNIETIQKSSNAVLLVTDKIEGSIDREVIITGGIKETTIAAAQISHLLSNALEIGTTETTYHVTLLISNNAIQAVTSSKLKSLIPTIDISSVFVPFSNYQSVYLYGRIPHLMSSIATLLGAIGSVSQKNQLFKEFAPEPFPIVGSESGQYIRSDTNQALLEKSKQAFNKYLQQDYKDDSKVNQLDPKKHSQDQIDEAMKECHKKSKSLETIKYAIDVPVDSIQNIIGHNGLKITEIRSKSNSNVIIDDHARDTQYKVVTISGLPESNLIALQYVKSLII